MNLGTSIPFLSFLSSEAPQLSSMFILWLERRSVKEFIVNSAAAVVGDEEEKLRFLFKIGAGEEEVKKFRFLFKFGEDDEPYKEESQEKGIVALYWVSH